MICGTAGLIFTCGVAHHQQCMAAMLCPSSNMLGLCQHGWPAAAHVCADSAVHGLSSDIGTVLVHGSPASQVSGQHAGHGVRPSAAVVVG